MTALLLLLWTLGGSCRTLVWGEWLVAVAGDGVGKGLRLGIGEGVRVSRKMEPAGTYDKRC